MGVEVRRVETEVGETGVGVSNRTDVTYEIGFATPSGGWVKFMSVPETTVQLAEANAAAAASGPSTPTNLATGEPADTSAPSGEGQPPTPADPSSDPTGTEVQQADQPADTPTDLSQGS